MTAEKEEPRAHGNALPQHILCIIVNIISYSYGTTTGWVAPMQPLLQSNYTNTNESSPLGKEAEPLTYDDVSWISGTFCIGGIIGTPLYGYLANAVGRKNTTLLSAIPFGIAYALILMATNPVTIFAARLIAGLGGGGISVVAPMYIGETAEVNNRGVLGSYFNLFICIGILSSYIVGSYTSYLILGLYCLFFPILFVVLWFWLPESPSYCVLNNRNEEALKALLKLRGNHRELIEAELSDLTTSIKDKSLSEKEKMSFKQMISEPETRKGFIIGGTLMTIQQMSGISPILNYTVVIFEASGSEMSPNLAAITVGILQVFGAIVATLLMDRAGRKLLLIISSVGMALSLAGMASFFHLKSIDYDPAFMRSIGWLPVTCMATFVVVYGLGFGPVPYVIIGEIFKTEARSAATSFSTFLIWAEAFILLKFYSKLNDLIGTDSCFGLFSFCCVLGALFTYFYIPETKGKSLEMILWELGGKKPVHHFEENNPIPLVSSEGKRHNNYQDDPTEETV